MDDTLKNELLEKIKTQEQGTIEFANSAQTEVNKRQQEIQQKNVELQNVIKAFQKEIDRREGAIDQLKALVTDEPVEDTPEPKTKKTPKVKDKKR